MLSNDTFAILLEKRFKQQFDIIPKDNDLKDLFNEIEKYTNVDIYIKLLSYIDMWDFDNFQRYFLICLRKYCSDEYISADIENIKYDMKLQILCIICLQHYFL
jgi:hypothetical protein